MAEVIVLTETDLRASTKLDLEIVDCIDAAFRALATDNVVMPPVLSMHLPEVNGEVDIKTAYLPDFPGFAVKVSPGFFDNPSRGLSSTSGLMILFSAETGQVMAVLLDNGYLTDLRTAAAGAVAARALARVDASRATILGAGVQALLQLKALCLVRPITSATVWARNKDRAMLMAEQASTSLGIKVTATEDRASAVADADIIVTTTPATEPIVDAVWLRAGQHITAMGSDQPGKNELDSSCLKRADLYVPDRLSQTRLMGELRAAIENGVVRSDRTFAELGQVLNGTAPARTNSDQITIVDLTGTGVQDTAIANHVVTTLSNSESAT